jgi:hypothetical protein
MSNSLIGARVRNDERYVRSGHPGMRGWLHHARGTVIALLPRGESTGLLVKWDDGHETARWHGLTLDVNLSHWLAK